MRVSNDPDRASEGGAQPTAGVGRAAVRHRGRALALGLTLLGLVACSSGPPPPHPVVLVIMDALAAKRVTHLGYERATTPNLDKLAADGTSFTKAFAPSPYTLASVTSLLTGKLPDVHGIVAGANELSESHRTIAEALRARGWRTLGATSNLNGSSLHGQAQGFESFHELYRSAGSTERGGKRRDTELELRKEEGLHVVQADEFPPVLDGWIDDLDDDEQPFFYLHMLEPHSPYQPPAEYISRFRDPDYAGVFKDGSRDTVNAGLGKPLDLTPADEQALVDLHDATLSYGDEVLGQLLARLGEAGYYDEGLIIVLADHGESFWEHGHYSHNYQLYDESMAVPLVVKFPESWGREPGRCDELVSILDVFPSLIEWLALEPAGEQLDGISLERALTESGSSDGRALFMRTHHDDPDFALRTATTKIVLHNNRESAHGRRVIARKHPGRLEAFDLVRDPIEKNPKAPRELQGGPELLEALRSMIKLTGKVRAGVAREPTEAEREALRELGYF